MRSALPYLTPRGLDLSSYAPDADNDVDRYIEHSNGIIVAQVVVDESGSDELMITEHPVQRGATISDHAVRRPCEVRIRMGWSSAYLRDEGLGSVSAIYETILTLQGKREPFTIYTGKRVYENMLVASIQTSNDAKTEYTFLADISFREVVLVDTSVYTDGRVYSRRHLKEPEKTTPTETSGEKQAMPANVDEAGMEDFVPTDPALGGAPTLLRRSWLRPRQQRQLDRHR
jgi:hypothetical protein